MMTPELAAIHALERKSAFMYAKCVGMTYITYAAAGTDSFRSPFCTTGAGRERSETMSDALQPSTVSVNLFVSTVDMAAAQFL